jgi:hypothetical protein
VPARARAVRYAATSLRGPSRAESRRRAARRT